MKSVNNACKRIGAAKEIGAGEKIGAGKKIYIQKAEKGKVCEGTRDMKLSTAA